MRSRMPLRRAFSKEESRAVMILESEAARG